MNFEQACRIFRGQIRSTEMWCSQDKNLHATQTERENLHPALVIPHVRNISLAIGKLNGIFNVLMGYGEELPEDIIQAMLKYNEINAKKITLVFEKRSGKKSSSVLMMERLFVNLHKDCLWICSSSMPTNIFVYSIIVKV